MRAPTARESSQGGTTRHERRHESALRAWEASGRGWSGVRAGRRRLDNRLVHELAGTQCGHSYRYWEVANCEKNYSERDGKVCPGIGLPAINASALTVMVNSME